MPKLLGEKVPQKLAASDSGSPSTQRALDSSNADTEPPHCCSWAHACLTPSDTPLLSTPNRNFVPNIARSGWGEELHLPEREILKEVPYFTLHISPPEANTAMQVPILQVRNKGP